jgi:hypothetical protein
MSRLSPDHPLSASSDSTQDRVVPETDFGQEKVAITRVSPIYGATLRVLRFGDDPRGTSRALSHAGRTADKSWILAGCGPDGVRPRRVDDLPAPGGQTFETRH